MSHRLGANRVAWARRIAAGHRRAATRPWRAVMELALPRAPAFHTTNRHEHRTTVVMHVHPERHTMLELRVMGARDRGRSFTSRATVMRSGRDRAVPLAPSPRAGVAAASASRFATVRAMPSAPAPVGATGGARVDAAVERIVRRYERVEVATRSTRVERTRVDVAAEVARVLTPTAFPDGDTVRGADTGAIATPGPAGTTFRSIDLDGLTDRIVTRLDDRLIAHRERLGHAF